MCGKNSKRVSTVEITKYRAENVGGKSGCRTDLGSSGAPLNISEQGNDMIQDMFLENEQWCWVGWR